MNAAPERRGITFHWEVLRRFPTVLPGFILISFLGHAATFFIFRVVYPPQATMAAPPPAITILDPKRPDHQALLRWIEAEDPAPFTETSGITDRLLQVTYRPSYAIFRTPPLTLPEEPVPVQFPPARDPLAIIRSAEKRPSSPPRPRPGNPTRVILSDDLGKRVPASIPQIVASVTSTEPLEPASFLVGIDERGGVQYVMLESSSGNPAMDDLAEHYVATLKLEPSDASITWGRISIEWGPEAYSKSKPAP